MKHRIFILILILVLILLNALQTQVQDASPLSDTPSILGVPFWQLKTALSAGLFTATSMMAAAGIGAYFWAGLLPACGARWTPEPELLQLGRCGTWCAWPIAASCLSGLSFFVYPWMRQDYGEGTLSGLLLMAGQMTLALIILISIGFMQHSSKRNKLQLVIVFLSASTALSCGQLWWWGRALDFLVISMASSLAVIILLPHRPETRPQLGALLAVSLALCVYIIGFGNMMTAYAPTTEFHPAGAASSGILITGSILVLLLTGIALALLPVLKQHSKLISALPILLCGLVIVISILLSGEHSPGTASTASDTPQLAMITRWCAGLAAGLTLALSLIPSLRRTALTLRLAAALTLLLSLCYAWLLMYSHAATNGYDWPLGLPATICYLLALLLLLALSTSFYLLKPSCRRCSIHANHHQTTSPNRNNS